MILQVNNFVNGIHLQSTFAKRTSSSKLDVTVEPRAPAKTASAVSPLKRQGDRMRPMEI